MTESFDTLLSNSYSIRTKVGLETRDIEFSLVFNNGDIADDGFCLDLIGLVEYYGDFENHIEAVFAAQAIMIKITAWLSELELESTCAGEPDWDDVAKDQRLERGAA